MVMSVVHLSDGEFNEVVINSEIPVLVDFYADWCAPCSMASPVLEELSNEYEGKIRIVKIDIDKDQEVASRYGISSIPTVLLFVNGEVLADEVGFQGKAKYDALIQKAILKVNK